MDVVVFVWVVVQWWCYVFLGRLLREVFPLVCELGFIFYGCYDHVCVNVSVVDVLDELLELVRYVGGPWGC